MFLVIIFGIIAGNVVWWRWADRRVRGFRHTKLWRWVVGVFAAMQMSYISLYVVAPAIARRSHTFPMPVMALLYLWCLLVLPATLLWIAAAWTLRKLKGAHFHRNRSGQENSGSDGSAAHAHSEREPDVRLSRRQWLSAAAVSVPPLAAAAIAAGALAQLNDLRLREIDVPIRKLPPPLDGFTIAQVTDIHIGKFTRASLLSRVVEMTNQLRADLIVFAGDLIDLSLGDFSSGVEVLRKLGSRFGMVMIEGNHDLIEDPDEFERRARDAKLPILLDDTTTLNLRGVPVQFLGIRWGQLSDGPRRHSSDAVIRDSVTRVVAQRKPDAFPILLAHHPHAFDTAIEAGIPLTLSGHTHGGQLMLNERLGAGPLMFRYWSGLYQRASSSLVVSNGAGNWFPLRINAPAEIVKVTLRIS